MENWVNEGKTGVLPQQITISGELRWDPCQERTLMTAFPKLLPCPSQHRDSTHTPENSHPFLLLHKQFWTTTVPYCTTGTLWNLECYFHWTYNFSLSIISLGFCVWLCVSDLVMPTTSWTLTSRTTPTVSTGDHMRLAVSEWDLSTNAERWYHRAVTAHLVTIFSRMGGNCQHFQHFLSSATVLFPVSHCSNPEIRQSCKLQVIAWIKPYISP